MGEFERLKEFGITASQAGDMVTFTFGDMKVKTTKDSKAIQKAITGIFDKRYEGAMARQAGTYAGMMSMLSDRWTNFKRNIGDGGVFDFVKRQLGGLLKWLDEASSDGRLDRWAKEISDSLVDVAKSMSALVSAVDWPAFARDIATVTKAIADLVREANSLDGLFDFSKPMVEGRPDLIYEGLQGAKGFRRKYLERGGVLDNLATGRRQRPVELPSLRPRAGPPAGPMPGLGGGPLKLEGKLKVELMPGMKIVKNEVDLSDRRGPAGGRP